MPRIVLFRCVEYKTGIFSSPKTSPAVFFQFYESVANKIGSIYLLGKVSTHRGERASHRVVQLLGLCVCVGG